MSEQQKQKVSVDAEALRRVLTAIIGAPHYIRELQATRSALAGLPMQEKNPIDILIEDYNNEIERLKNQGNENVPG